MKLVLLRAAVCGCPFNTANLEGNVRGPPPVTTPTPQIAPDPTTCGVECVLRAELTSAPPFITIHSPGY